MTLRLICTQAQFEALHEAADTGRSRDVVVNRRALQAMQVDHTRLIQVARRAMEIVEPGGDHDLNRKEKRLKARGWE